MKYYIGIDPGVKGCISIVDETGKFIESFFLLKNAKNVDTVEISNTLLLSLIHI